MKSKESTCLKCGKCCRIKMSKEAGITAIDWGCPFFDEKTKLCTVYQSRFWVQPQCQTVEQMIAKGLAPPTCGYVQKIKGYKSIVKEWE